MQAALLALRLNPLIPPLLGGRFAGQIFAMVLIAGRTTIDLSPTLGKVTKLLWIDWFYSFQFITCLLSLIETTTVHHLVRTNRESLALRVDQVRCLVAYQRHHHVQL